jgi:alginate O-acetyltransferase complex protein AlgI
MADIAEGFPRFALGLTKKVVIADPVGQVADVAFAAPGHPSFATAWIGALAFTVQIYFDFSGYTDMAIGMARMFGLRFPENFARPYSSVSMTDFWRRWHMTLSRWFRDYVYIPLGGNRGTALRTSFNLFLTFLLSGFWHGASWNFVMWGAYHGLLLILQRVLNHFVPALFTARWLRPLRIVVLFALVNVGWLMFRETNVHQLLRDLTLLPGNDSRGEWMAAGQFLGLILLYASPLIADSVLYASGVYQRARDTTRWALAQGALVMTLIIGMAFFYSEIPGDFIYFQF